MSGPPELDCTRPRLADGLWLGLAALIAYVLLWQATFYTSDGHMILVRLENGEDKHNAHFLYMPGLMLLAELLAPVGIGARHAALLYSSLGTAAGVVIAHAACARSGLDRARAALATALVAAAPPVAFFATVIEFHGPYFAPAQLAFFAAVALAWRPRAGLALAVGVVGAIAFLFHTSALVLPGLLVPWYLAARREAGWRLQRRDLGLSALAATAHFAAIWLALRGLVALGFPEFPPKYDQGRLTGVSWSTLTEVPEMFWQEWGAPYLPLSVLALLAVGFRAVRWRWAAFALGLLAFLIPCVVLLTGRPERGAYLLPLALPAALLVASVAGRRLLAFVLALSVGAAIAGVWQHDALGPRYRSFAAGIAELADGAPVAVIVAEEVDLGACLVAMPDVPRWLITDLAVLPEEVVAPQLAALPAVVQPFWDQGRQVFFSARAEQYLRDPVRRPSGRLLVDAMHARLRLERVAAQGFDGYRVLPRS